jgi:hypothetical protein
MEWPLDRVDPATLDANKKKNRSFYGVIIGECSVDSERKPIVLYVEKFLKVCLIHCCRGT